MRDLLRKPDMMVEGRQEGIGNQTVDHIVGIKFWQAMDQYASGLADNKCADESYKDLKEFTLAHCSQMQARRPKAKWGSCSRR